MAYPHSLGYSRQTRGLLLFAALVASLVLSYRLAFPATLSANDLQATRAAGGKLQGDAAAAASKGNDASRSGNSRIGSAASSHLGIDTAHEKTFWHGIANTPLWSSLGGGRSPSAAGPTVHISTAADTSIMVGLLGLVNSTRENTRHPNAVHWHIISPTQLIATEITDKLQATFPGIQAFPYGLPERIMKTNFKVADPKRKGSLSRPVNYARYALGDLFPHLDKVIYLDPDTVFLDDIVKLWQTDLKGKPIAVARACRDMAAFEKQYDMNSRFLDAYDPRECSFNAGLMLFDLDIYRQQDYTSKLLDVVDLNNKHGFYHLGSQPPINMVFYRNYTLLDARYNRMNLAGLRQEGPYGRQPSTIAQQDLDNAVILHWNGALKPWTCEPGLHHSELWYKYMPEHAATLPANVSLEPICAEAIHTHARLDSTDNKFTVILSTDGAFFDDVMEVISRLRWNDYVDKIVTIWNNKSVRCPPEIEEVSQCVYPESDWSSAMRSLADIVETKAVLFHSDNIVVKPEDLNAAFGIWNKYPKQILGFQPLIATPGNGAGTHPKFETRLKDGHYNAVESDLFFAPRDSLLAFAADKRAEPFAASGACSRFALQLFNTKSTSLPVLWFRGGLETFRPADDPKLLGDRQACLSQLVDTFASAGRFPFRAVRKHFYVDRPTQRVISLYVRPDASYCSSTRGAGRCP